MFVTLSKEESKKKKKSEEKMKNTNLQSYRRALIKQAINKSAEAKPKVRGMKGWGAISVGERFKQKLS